MRVAKSLLGIAVAMSLQLDIGSSDALGDGVISTHTVAADPICTITDEAKCWSPAEVEKALAIFFCANGEQPCGEPTLEKTGLHAEMIAPRPPATKQRAPEPVPDEPMLDASGVPEFNAWEEGCD